MVRYCQTDGLVPEKMEKHRTVCERMLDDEIRGAFIERKRSSYNVSEEELMERKGGFYELMRRQSAQEKGNASASPSGDAEAPKEFTKEGQADGGR